MLQRIPNHRWEIIKALQTGFETLKLPVLPDTPAPGTLYNPALIQVSRIFQDPTDPINISTLEDSDLPALFYRYGDAAKNDGVSDDVNQSGEELSFRIFAVVTATVDKSLIEVCSDMHTSIEFIANSHQHAGGQKTRFVEVGRVRTIFEGLLADREILEFIINIGHTNALFNT